MGLQVNNVSVQTKDGDTVTSFWIKVDSRLTEKPTPKILAKLTPYRSEATHDAGLEPLDLIDTGAGLATDVPAALSSIADDLTPAQYANVDMTQVHNQLRDILIQGDAHARWGELIGAEVAWAGFGTGNVVTDMPV